MFRSNVQIFFSQKLQSGLLRATKPAKYKFLNSCVRTIASFRWSRWPYTKTYGMKLDALQRKFLTALMQIKSKPGEPYDAFVQRRHITGGHLARACGRWSQAWASSVTSWDAHVPRAHDPSAWSHALLDLQPDAWLTLQDSCSQQGTNHALEPEPTTAMFIKDGTQGFV